MMYKLLLPFLILFAIGTYKIKSKIWRGQIDKLPKNQADSITSLKFISPVKDTVITIYFKGKGLNINPTDINRLKQISSICISDTFCFLKIIGFTDTTGTEVENNILSEKRVNKIFKYLNIENKIKSHLVYTTWLGESKNIYDLHIQPLHLQENCVDIWIQLKRASR